MFHRVADQFLRRVLRVLPPSQTTEYIALWWGYRYRPTPRVVKLRGGGRINLTANDHLQLLLYYLGTFEPHSLKQLYSVPRGGTIIDVGANIGLYTIRACAIVGPKGHVVSIEAAPPHADAVQKNIELNDVHNATLLNCAVGDMNGFAVLTLPRDTNLGMFTLGDVDGVEKFRVPIRRIDDIISENNVDRVDFIKMDIEGSELHALRGARQTLERFHPTILIELNEIALKRCGTSSREVKSFLSSLGYKGSIIGRRGLEPIAEETSHECDECLFVLA
jgi:FkbM family methyltransferase